MTLKIGWLHEAEHCLGTWLHGADDWHAVSKPRRPFETACRSRLDGHLARPQWSAVQALAREHAGGPIAPSRRARPCNKCAPPRPVHISTETEARQHSTAAFAFGCQRSCA
jgi:hypothetical protein